MNKKGLSTHAGLTYCLAYAVKDLARGIGTSRRNAQKVNGGLSDSIHSDRTHSRYMAVAGKFVDYCKEHAANRLHQVTMETVSGYFQSRIDAGAAQGTLKVEASALNKFLCDALARKDLRITNPSDYWQHGKASSRTIPFDSPQRIL